MIGTNRAFLLIRNLVPALIPLTSAASALAGDFYEKDGVAIKG